MTPDSRKSNPAKPGSASITPAAPVSTSTAVTSSSVPTAMASGIPMTTPVVTAGMACGMARVTGMMADGASVILVVPDEAPIVSAVTAASG